MESKGGARRLPRPTTARPPGPSCRALDTLAEHLPDDPFDLEGAERRFEQVVPKNAAARAALSGALHDLVGKRLGQPLWRLWGLDPGKAPHVVLHDRDRHAGEDAGQKVPRPPTTRSSRSSWAPTTTRRCCETIRDATDKPIRVDANAGWTRERALAMLPVLKDFGVELLEQPLAPEDLEGLAAVRRASPGIPVVVDESCIVATDIPKVAGAVDGINIKLAKCGSLREALRMIATARAHGLLVMVGCMIETSVGITAAAHFTPLVDVADLDGAALTVDDPFTGARIERGRITLPTGPGLGVARR